MSMHVCPKCEIEKPDSEFYGGKFSACKVCRNKASKENYFANRERYKVSARASYLRNRESILAKQRAYERDHRGEASRRQKEWVAKNVQRQKEIQEKARLKFRYKLSGEQFSELLQKQDGKCAVCGNDFKNTKDRHIDHNHETQKVRAILCKNCNLAEGFLKTSDLAMKMYQYILKHELIESNA